jgi:hypothetical protein
VRLKHGTGPPESPELEAILHPSEHESNGKEKKEEKKEEKK